MRHQYILGADILDVAELILNAGIADGDELDAFLSPVSDVDVHHFEVPHPFRLFNLLRDILFHLIREIRLCRVNNPPGVSAIVIVAPAKDGRFRIEQGAVHSPDVVRQAVDLLLRIVLTGKQHILSRVNQRLPLLQHRKTAILAAAKVHPRQRYQVGHIAPAIAYLE